MVDKLAKQAVKLQRVDTEIELLSKAEVKTDNQRTHEQGVARILGQWDYSKTSVYDTKPGGK